MQEQLEIPPYVKTVNDFNGLKRKMENLVPGKVRIRYCVLMHTCVSLCITGELILMQDTITGFLMAGVGNVDLRRKTNYLIVDSSMSLSLNFGNICYVFDMLMNLTTVSILIFNGTWMDLHSQLIEIVV